MMNLIQGQISGSDFLKILLAFLIIGYFLYKEWPEFKKRIVENSKRAIENAVEDKELNNRIETVEKILAEHQDMLSRDYKKLSALEDSAELNRRINKQTLEEMEIIMKALLAALNGLQELGADGVTKTAQLEINDYLSKIAHRKLADE